MTISHAIARLVMYTRLRVLAEVLPEASQLKHHGRQVEGHKTRVLSQLHRMSGTSSDPTCMCETHFVNSVNVACGGRCYISPQGRAGC